jgi:hypothetical protein
MTQVIRSVALLTVVAAALAVPPNFRLPEESAGIQGIVETLIAAFDQADIVALGEVRQRKADSDLRIALVRYPDFTEKARSIVVEFASTTEQATLDRDIQGEDVSEAQPRTDRPRTGGGGGGRGGFGGGRGRY